MLRVCLLLVALAACATAVPLFDTVQDAKCNMKSGMYPPPANHTIKWVTINLDEPAATRWNHVVTPMAKDIEAMLDSVTAMIPPKILDPLMKRLDGRAENLADALPAPYGEEIKGISKATGVDLGLLLIYNFFYEVLGACTSIVAENEDTHNLYHARNLDFGLFMGIDHQTETWKLTELLRPLLFNANFTRGGVTQYQGTFYGGYVGLHTGMKPGAFSITIDTRFDNNYDKYLLAWLDGKDRSEQWTTFACRDAMEHNATLADAQAHLTAIKMVGPSYVILGGNKPGDGAILTRSAPTTLTSWTLAERESNHSFYLLQTNYDQGNGPNTPGFKPAPKIDDRRDPGDKCMDTLGSSGVSLPHLFDVLSAQPNLNQLTTFTVLMEVASGRYESYLQYCPHPCTPW